MLRGRTPSGDSIELPLRRLSSADGPGNLCCGAVADEVLPHPDVCGLYLRSRFVGSCQARYECKGPSPLWIDKLGHQQCAAATFLGFGSTWLDLYMAAAKGCERKFLLFNPIESS